MKTFKRKCFSAMRIIPSTEDQWLDLILLPFRAYGVFAFIITLVWTRELRGEPLIPYLLLGYVVCLFCLVLADTVLTVSRRPGEPRPTWRWTFAVLGLGVASAYMFLPELAK